MVKSKGRNKKISEYRIFLERGLNSCSQKHMKTENKKRLIIRKD